MTYDIELLAEKAGVTWRYAADLVQSGRIDELFARIDERNSARLNEAFDDPTTLQEKREQLRRKYRPSFTVPNRSNP